jgi:hypothetical protein
MPRDIDIVQDLEEKYRAQFLLPVKYVAKLTKGCRGCGDEKIGPWTLSVMSSVVPEINTGLIFVAVLCEKCLGDEGKMDDVAEAVVAQYLAQKKR